MMEDNPSLESLTIAADSRIQMMEHSPLDSSTIANGSEIVLEKLSALVSALQRNTTLKTLGFEDGNRVSYLVFFFFD
jgi:hypothetical protein